MCENIEYPTIYNFKNLIGNKYGKLTVIRYAGIINGKTHWICNCECDEKEETRKEKVVESTKLKCGYTKSCGCLHKENSKRFKTHGETKSLLYRIWSSMRERCNNQNNQAYHNYGGRGIKVCERWDNSYENFRDDMGSRPVGDDGMKFTLERRDNNKNYCPENCYWASRVEQCNNKRDNVLLNYNGKCQTATQWAKELGVSASLIRGRLLHGWSEEDALLVPSGMRRNKFHET